MRRYETIFIVDPDLADEGRNQLFDKTKDLIAAQNGFLVDFDQWGSRKLAYDIRKKPRGYYVCMDYCGTSALVNELERTFRLDDRYLKFMTVLLDAEADLESIKAEMAEKEKAKEAAEAESNAEVTEETPAASETEAEAAQPETEKEEE
jgi:small subunit ribosomal protein S6